MLVLKQLLAPPIFKDEEKTHQAFLLHIILSVLITLPILYGGYILIQKPEEFGQNTYIYLNFGNHQRHIVYRSQAWICTSGVCDLSYRDLGILNGGDCYQFKYLRGGVYTW